VSTQLLKSVLKFADTVIQQHHVLTVRRSLRNSHPLYRQTASDKYPDVIIAIIVSDVPPLNPGYQLHCRK